MTKAEHLARIIERITDADDVRTDALAEEVAELWAAVDGAAGALATGAGGALVTRSAEARAIRWLAGNAAIGTAAELLALADEIEAGEVEIP